MAGLFLVNAAKVKGITEAAPIEQPDVVPILPELLFRLFVRNIPVRIVEKPGEGVVEIGGKKGRVIQSRSDQLIGGLHLVEPFREPYRPVVQPLVPDLMREQVPAVDGQDGIRRSVVPGEEAVREPVSGRFPGIVPEREKEHGVRSGIRVSPEIGDGAVKRMEILLELRLVQIHILSQCRYQIVFSTTHHNGIHRQQRVSGHDGPGDVAGDPLEPVGAFPGIVHTKHRIRRRGSPFDRHGHILIVHRNGKNVLGPRKEHVPVDIRTENVHQASARRAITLRKRTAHYVGELRLVPPGDNGQRPAGRIDGHGTPIHLKFLKPTHLVLLSSIVRCVRETHGIQRGIDLERHLQSVPFPLQHVIRVPVLAGTGDAY